MYVFGKKKPNHDNATEPVFSDELAAKLAKVAAKWWADSLRGPIVDNVKSKPEAVALIADLTQPTKKQIDDFQRKLADLIRKWLKTANSSTGKHAEIEVDYNPHRILVDAAVASGFTPKSVTFPWKTLMEIRVEGVTVNGKKI